MTRLILLLGLSLLSVSANAWGLNFESKVSTYEIVVRSLRVAQSDMVENPDGSIVVSSPCLVIGKREENLAANSGVDDSLHGFCKLLDRQYYPGSAVLVPSKSVSALLDKEGNLEILDRGLSIVRSIRCY